MVNFRKMYSEKVGNKTHDGLDKDSLMLDLENLDNPPLDLDLSDKPEVYKVEHIPGAYKRLITKEIRRSTTTIWGMVSILFLLLIFYMGILLLTDMKRHFACLEQHRHSQYDAKQSHFEKDYSRAFYYSWIASRETTDKLKNPEGRVVSCYYNTPEPSDNEALLPSSIQPNLCTHINIAFARVVNNQIMLESNQIAIIKELVKIKMFTPDIKLLLSIGGAGNDGGFAKMVKNHANRKEFIKSIKYILRNYSLDGVDLDWEFPGVSEVVDLPEKRERQHFSQLLREIRMEYFREKRNYLLTVAVAAPETIVNTAYDVDQLNLYTDYVNVMTYDYHFFSKFTPFTGLNSPLYALPSEQLYMATLNVNYTVHMYLKKGLEPSKIVVGIPTYGHTFKLVNPDNPAIGAPCSDYGCLGSKGFVDYSKLCQFIKHASNVTFVKGNVTMVPYLYYKDLWVSYDDPHSVIKKANYIKEHGLRGAMIYSLNADDHVGICDGDWGLYKNATFPLVRALRGALDVEYQVEYIEQIN